MVKNPPANTGDQEMQVWSLHWEDPLEKKLAIWSSIHAWKIPWTGEPGRIQSMEMERVRNNWAWACARTHTHTHIHTHTHTNAHTHTHCCPLHTQHKYSSISVPSVGILFQAITGDCLSDSFDTKFLRVLQFHSLVLALSSLPLNLKLVKKPIPKSYPWVSCLQPCLVLNADSLRFQLQFSVFYSKRKWIQWNL